MSLGVQEKEKPAKRKKVDSDVEMEDVAELETASSQPQPIDSDDSGTEETPMSSQGSAASSNRLKEMRQPPASSSSLKGGFVEDEEDTEDDQPVVSTARRRVRADFIVDSDDDE
jgi:hypothetical protein